MDTSREDFGIVIRSAFLRKGTQQKFSLFILIIFSVILLMVDSIDIKPLNYVRVFVKDTIYRGSLIASSPSKGINFLINNAKEHFKLESNYIKLKKENVQLKEKIHETDFLFLENNQLRKLIDEQASSKSNLVSARVIFNKQSPYLNSFIINIGSNKNIKKGMAVLDGKNFIGRIVDTNYFSSRVLLISDLNSKIPVIIEPSGHHAILSGHGNKMPSLEYLPEKHSVVDGDTVYTSGREGIFVPGLTIGKIKTEKDQVNVLLFSDLSQITFVNINLGDLENKK